MSIFTRTENNAIALKGTGKPTVDLFFNIGSSRNAQDRVSDLFDKSCMFDIETSTAILLWARDIRGGAGERQSFRTCLRELISSDPVLAEKVIRLIPLIGRYDDLNTAIGTRLENVALSVWKEGLDAKNLLAFKWVNIKKDNKLRNYLGMSERNFRKYIAGVRKGKIVEDLMCRGEWNGIVYEHVPSVASARYGKAFKRHDEVRYSAWRDSDETKVNAQVLYPYDVYRTGYEDAILADKLWKALPKMEITKNILPMTDTSGSMSSHIASGKISCMEIAISLSVYLAQNNTGIFRNRLLTFSESPEIVRLSDRKPIMDTFRDVQGLHWGGNTNFERAFRLILDEAVKSRISRDQMPEIILVLSDMQFDEATPRGYGQGRTLDQSTLWDRTPKRVVRESGMDTMHRHMKAEFEANGYNLPTIVYWNLNAKYDNFPASVHDNVALVSGFSPVIMKAVLKGEKITPEFVMENAISRYRELLKK